MFDIGFWELAILFGLGLIVLGPEKLPQVANQLGNWAGQARRMARNLSEQMRSEIDLNDPLNINKPSSHSSTSTNQTAADENKVETPAWQTSAGLRPGFNSDDESDPDSYDHEKEEHPEYEPISDAGNDTAADTAQDATPSKDKSDS